MHFLNRLGSWLRPQSAEGLPAIVGPSVAGPRASPESFRAGILDAIDTALLSRLAVLRTLDPTVFVLAIPAIAELDAEEEQALSKSVDAALDAVKSPGRSMASVAWSALKEARPAFGPSYLEWAEDHVDAFDGTVSLLFFVDMNEISSAMAEAVTMTGFRARLSKKRPLLLVEDGRFRAHVGLNALIAEAIWTGNGPKSVIHRRARALTGEFRAFQSMLVALRHRFPEAQIEINKAYFVAKVGTAVRRLDYRHLCAAHRASGRPLGEWLKGTPLHDLDNDDGVPGMMLRSPAYPRARPNVLAHTFEGYALVAVRVDEGRVAPVEKLEPVGDVDTDLDRMRYFEEETARQIGTMEFEAYALTPQLDGHSSVLILVGDQVASIAIDPALVRAAFEVFYVPGAQVRLKACAENVVAIVGPVDGDEGALERLLDQALDMGCALEREIFDDASDRLAFDATLDLPPLGAGRFHLNEVDDEVIELLDKARGPLFSPAQQEHLRGVALTLLGEFGRAVTALEKAVRGQRDDVDVNMALGRAHLLNDSPVDAAAFLTRAHELAPLDAEIANTLGLAHFGAGNLDGAVTAFGKACEVDEDEPAFLVNYARVLLESDRFTEAHKVLARALALAPHSAEAHATMALMLHREGDSDGAKSYAQKAIALDPDDTGAQSLLLQISHED